MRTYLTEFGKSRMIPRIYPTSAWMFVNRECDLAFYDPCIWGNSLWMLTASNFNVKLMSGLQQILKQRIFPTIVSLFVRCDVVSSIIECIIVDHDRRCNSILRNIHNVSKLSKRWWSMWRMRTASNRYCCPTLTLWYAADESVPQMCQRTDSNGITKREHELYLTEKENIDAVRST